MIFPHRQVVCAGVAMGFPNGPGKQYRVVEGCFPHYCPVGAVSRSIENHADKDEEWDFLSTFSGGIIQARDYLWYRGK